MNAAGRRPETCQFRRIDDYLDAAPASCELVGRLVGRAVNEAYAVENGICSACCRYPLPDGPRLNPVVASLVFSASKRASRRGPNVARDRVTDFQTRQFAIRWLADADGSSGATELSSASRFISSDSRSVGNGAKASRIGRRTGRKPNLRVGLVGRHSRFGLGHQNRDIANHLGVERWLVPRFVRHRDPTPHGLPCQIDTMSTGLEPVELAAWLDGLDAVVFVESPVFPQLTSLARRLGVSVVCIPNWEWLHAGLDWLDDVDLMLCPTHYTAGLLSEWKARFGFGWIIDTVPWPIDTERFHFVPRRVCQTFVFVNGSGGAAAVADDRSKAMFQRKGLDVLLAAARKVPQIPLIIYASSDDIESEPPNVQWRPPPADNTQLYHDGDVYIQPSRWEGLGLPLLECQAAGMPLITTNLPPMNEHRPLALIPAMDEAVFLSPEFCIPAAHIEPEDLAEVMRSVHGQEINAVSIRARQFVERDHSWHVAKPRILNRISQLVCDGPQVNS